MKLFYGRKLPLSIISWSVCPWQGFPAWSNVLGKARSLPYSGAPKGTSLQEAWPYLQTLD